MFTIKLVLGLLAVVCVAAFGLSLHTLVCFNKVNDSFVEWSRSVSDECNSHMQSYYSLLVDSMKKDVIAFFEEKDKMFDELKNKIEDNGE